MQLSGLWLRGRDCDFNPATFRMSEFLADEVKLVGALVDRTDHGPTWKWLMRSMGSIRAGRIADTRVAASLIAAVSIHSLA